MITQDSRTRDASDTRDPREDIIGAAKALIACHGYHAITVEDIRRAAGVARATFYFHFRSKKQLFVALGGRIVEDLYQVAGTTHPGDDEYTRIVKNNAAYLRAWAAERRILGELFALSLVDGETGQLYRRNRLRFEQRMERRLAQMMEQGRIPPASCGLMAVTLSGTMESFVRRYFSFDGEALDERYTFSEAVEAISTAWYRIIYGRTPPAYPYERHQLHGDVDAWDRAISEGYDKGRVD